MGVYFKEFRTESLELEDEETRNEAETSIMLSIFFVFSFFKFLLLSIYYFIF